MTIWTVKKNKALPGAVEQICRMFGVSPLAATVMLNRGLGSVKAVEYYKNSSIEDLHTLADIPDVKKAFLIILSAIDNRLPIVIYGDYDVDGVTSTVILYKGLRALGADVDYYIPDRHTDGYGLNPGAIKKIDERGCKLLITCDNGIAAKNETAYAKSLGMQVVILDHHEPAFQEISGNKQYLLPEADAVVDLKLEHIAYPFKDLCAGGLCYKFIREMFSYLGKELAFDDELAVFAAIATVCDVVELRDENRIIVRHGLDIINSRIDNMGLRKLVNANNLQDKKLTEYTFGFVIGPCINAGGRLEAAALAAELFMSGEDKRTDELTERLFELNSIRKEMTRKAYERLAEKADGIDDRVLVLYDGKIDESIAGIVAGRLKERYNKPTIVLTKSEGGVKGSGRSIEAYDMFRELSQYRELFTKFGGHKMAAGMSLPEENIESLKNALNNSCTLTPDDMERRLCADKIINMKDVNIYTARDMEMFKPYGNGNLEPLIAAVGLNICNLRFVGVDKNIAQLSFTDDSCNIVSAVCFDGEAVVKLINGYYGYAYIDEDKNVNGDLNNIKVDIMANLRVDDYNGNMRPKLSVKDMRVSSEK